VGVIIEEVMPKDVGDMQQHSRIDGSFLVDLINVCAMASRCKNGCYNTEKHRFTVGPK